MSIQKRSNGKWRARYRDPDGKEHAGHFHRKIDAQLWLAEVRHSLVTSTYVDLVAGRTTLRAYYQEWSARQLREATTTRGADLAVRECTFADVPLVHLRRSHVEQWVKEMASELAASTVTTRYKYVRAVLRAAVRDRVLAVDPSDGVVLPRVRRASAAMVLPSTGQVTALVAAVAQSRRAMVAVMAFAGLRVGEAAALHVEDIVFLRRELRVARQVQRDGVRLPKYGGERTVYLADGVLELLAEHIATTGTNGWLFPGRDGQPTPRHEGWWKAACARAGVTDVSPHDLRRFYASGLIASGCDVVTVQRALGHANAAATGQSTTPTAAMAASPPHSTRPGTPVTGGVETRGKPTRGSGRCGTGSCHTGCSGVAGTTDDGSAAVG